MKKISFLFVFGMLAFAATGLADTVYLKSGKKVTGKIIEENSYSVRILVNNSPYVYYVTEYDKVIKGEEPQEQKTMTETNEPKEITPEKRELILRLLDANGARDSMNRIFTRIIEQAPEAERAQIRGLLKTDEIIQELVPTYAKYYSVDELRELITFYKGPTGAKHLANTPKIMEETMNVAAQYFKAKAGTSPNQTK